MAGKRVRGGVCVPNKEKGQPERRCVSDGGNRGGGVVASLTGSKRGGPVWRDGRMEGKE